jgi:hypothetical protein
MNERIKELAREAGFYANPDVEKFERFAELVRQDEREQEPVAWDGNCVLGHCGSPDGCDRSGCCRADTAPPKPEQEPVAYKYTDKTNPLVFYFTTHKDSLPNPDVIETELYTAPPKREWVGLTDKELEEIQYARDTEVEYVTYDEGEDRFEIDIFPENFARAIEAKLKEKNYG